MGEEIQFIDGSQVVDLDGGFVQFTALRDGDEMRFRISREALDSLAAAPIPTGALLERFGDMKTRIWDIARRKADAVGGGHSGVIMIRHEDI